MFFCAHGNVLKLKCKPQPQVLTLTTLSLLSIKLKLKKELMDYSKLLDPSGLDKFLTLLLNLLLLKLLLKKCINMFSLNLNLNIAMLPNSELPLPQDIWLVFSVLLSLTLLIPWFLN